MLLGKSAFVAAVLLAVPAVGAAVAVSDHMEKRAVAAILSDKGRAISSVEELQRVLRVAQDGDVIRLAAGHYPKLILAGIRKTGTVTITSADPANPAAIANLFIRDSAGLTLSGLELVASPGSDAGADGKGDEDGVAPQQGRPKPPGGSRFIFIVADSERITLDRLNVHGPIGNLEAASVLSPLLVRASRQVTVSNSRFSFMRHGLEMLDLDGFKVIGNDFSDLRTDGIRGGNSSNIEIAYNVMTDFFPAAGDHPDGIQLWALPRTTTMDNISIHDNIVVRGRGASTQGIFIRNVKNTFLFRNLIIRDNQVMGGLGNGIAVCCADGALIEGNRVINYPDRKISWIRLDTNRGVVMRNNRAPRFMVARSEVEDKHNKVDNPGKIDEPALVAQWLDAQPGRRRADSALQVRMTDRRGR